MYEWATRTPSLLPYNYPEVVCVTSVEEAGAYVTKAFDEDVSSIESHLL